MSSVTIRGYLTAIRHKKKLVHVAVNINPDNDKRFD
jgi:hypothetical protein